MVLPDLVKSTGKFGVIIDTGGPVGTPLATSNKYYYYYYYWFLLPIPFDNLE